MCGRSACTMAPDDIRRACQYRGNRRGQGGGNQGGAGGRNRGGTGGGNQGGTGGGNTGGKGKTSKPSQPRWVDAPGGQTYQPSHNVCPGTHTPILMSKTHVDYEQARQKKDKTDTESKTEAETETTTTVQTEADTETNTTVQTETEAETETDECPWVIQPMRWGLVPSWHSGESDKGVGYNMINARSDGILSKRTFKGPLEKGRRCVVLVDGYFEWQTKDGQKQPYFVYPPHNQTSEETETPEEEQAGSKRLLTLAGLFDIWRPKNGSPPLYSYSIITVEADKSLKWLHDRMPAILNGEEEVDAWLNAGEVPLKKAVEDLIRPVNSVTHHPVSTAVNNNKNKSEECTKPFDLEKEKKKVKASSNFMTSWLSKGKRTSTDSVKDLAKEEGVSAEKKAKVEGQEEGEDAREPMDV